MGCFLACFGGPKDRRRRRPRNRTPPRGRVQESQKPLGEWVPEGQKALQPSVSPTKPAVEELAAEPPPELKAKDEQGSISGARKRVTFDLNVKTITQVPAQEDAKYSSESDEEEEEGIEEESAPLKQECKSSPTAGSLPPSHRYQNCARSGDEEEEDDYEDCDFDEDDGLLDGGGDEEESYESYFSLPLEKEKEKKGFQEVSSPIPITASSPDREPAVAANLNARDRSQYVHSVLNPVENISQWREAKVRAATPTKSPNKENIAAEQEVKPGFSSEPDFKNQKHRKLEDSNPCSNCSPKQEVSVDASLSSWLATPRTSESHRSNSPMSREEQPILGALTVEDLKQSVTSSPRRSPSRSPDDIPIVGTVGSYWNSRSGSDVKGIPNTTSKYREDRRVNWHSTPFELRLDRALNKKSAEA